jgi:molecular chaperone GrpE
MEKKENIEKEKKVEEKESTTKKSQKISKTVRVNRKEYERLQEEVKKVEEYKKECAELKKEYEKLQEEARKAEEYLDQLKRLKAEFINYKRLQEKHNQEFIKFSNELLIIELLPILDNLDRALNSKNNSFNNFDSLLEGVKLVKKQFFEILSKNGLSTIDSVGKIFDPRFHEAIMRIEITEKDKDGLVMEEFQKGYTLHGKVIRPAKVSVASFTDNKKNSDEKKEVKKE